MYENIAVNKILQNNDHLLKKLIKHQYVQKCQNHLKSEKYLKQIKFKVLQMLLNA